MTWDDDNDSDGTPDDCDADDDNDGVDDDDDSHPEDTTQCSDFEAESCDDCSSTTYDTANDGADDDSDGICDLGDVCPGGDDYQNSDGDNMPNACDVDITLHEDANLISFYAIPEDNSTSTVFSSLTDFKGLPDVVIISRSTALALFLT